MTRLDGETSRERRWQRVAGLGVILIFILLGTNLLSGVENYQSQTAHHSTTVRQDAEILSLLKTVHDAQRTNAGTITDIKTLETQVADVIEGLPAADTQLGNFAKWLEICVGRDHETDCPAPPIPTSS